MNPELFKCPIEKVLRDLIGDMLLSGKQLFASCEYKDPNGNRIFAVDANGAVSFQSAQARVGRTRFQCQLYSTLTALS